jgi:hypothetical protein
VTLFRARAKPTGIVLFCQKCPKRIDAKDRLSKPLKRLLKPLGIKLVKTRCLGVCPKNALTLHDSRRPREWVIVRDGTPIDDVEQLFVEAVG